MPKFAILITQDELLWWFYTLVIEHKAEKPSVAFPTIDGAYKAAKHAANLRGYVNV